MGWNRGYTIFEATVVGAYDLGKLDKDLLAVLMRPYAGTDIDSGGRRGLLTTDGKTVEQVVIDIMEGGPLPPRPDENDDEALDDYNDAMYGLFYDVTKKHFGWY